MTAPIVELRKATKKYAGVPAIEDVDFASLPGEIYTLVGENGAGKSTLTKIMASCSFTSGQMLIEGKEVIAETPAQVLHLGIAMVFQETSRVLTITAGKICFSGKSIFSIGFAAFISPLSNSCRRCNSTSTDTVNLLGPPKSKW